MAKKPSELIEGEWIKIILNQHPDIHLLEGTPDPDIPAPSGAIRVEKDYGQVYLSSIDKNADPSSEGIVILSEDMPNGMALMDRIVEYWSNEPHAVVTTGK